MFAKVYACYLQMQWRLLAVGVYLLLGAYGMPRNREGKCTCPVDVFSKTGVYIEDFEKSRVEVPSFRRSFRSGHEMHFNFKTTSSNGILFHMSRAGKRHDFVALDIVDGHPRYHIRCRHSEATLTLSQVKVDDGEWHKVEFRRNNRRGQLFVDRKPFYHNYRVDCAAFTSLTFGGINPEPEFDNIRRALNIGNGHFEGCIRQVDMSTGYNEPSYHGVSPCS